MTIKNSPSNDYTASTAHTSPTNSDHYSENQPYHHHHNTHLKSSSSSSSWNDDSHLKQQNELIFQLQLEIQTLKQSLSNSSTTSKTELLDLLSEKDTLLKVKSTQVHVLNDKFLKISRAVGQMETERNRLKEREDTLQEENKKIHRHLTIRDKEVKALATRCAAQEEKLAELKPIKALERQVAQLETVIAKKDEEIEELGGVREEVQLCKQEMNNVLAKTRDLTKEHKKEKMADLENARLMMKEIESLEGQLTKKEEEMERLVGVESEVRKCREEIETVVQRSKGLTEERKKAVLEFESSQKNWNQKTSAMQEEIQAALQSKEDLNQDLQELQEMYSQSSKDVEELRKETENLKFTHEEEIAKLQKEMERGRTSAQSNLLESVQDVIAEKDNEAAEMASEHAQEMSSLREEFEQERLDAEDLLFKSVERAKLDKTKVIDEIELQLREKDDEILNQREKINAKESKIQQLKKEIERITKDLSDFTCQKQKEGQSFEEEKNKLILDKGKLQDEISSLNLNIEELVEENTSNANDFCELSKKFAKLQEELSHMTNQEKDFIQSEKENVQAISALRHNLKDTNEKYQEKESKLLDEIATLEKRFKITKNELSTLSSDSAKMFNELKEQCATEKTRADTVEAELEELKITCKEQKEAADTERELLSSNLASVHEQDAERAKEIKKLNEILSNEGTSLANAKENIARLNEKIEETELNAALIVDDLNGKLETSSEQIKALESQYAEMVEVKQNLERKMSSQQSQISSLQDEVLGKNSKLKQQDHDINMMGKSKNDQDIKLTSLRNELELLIEAYDKAKYDYSNENERLQQNIDKIRKEARSESESFQVDYKNLQRMYAEAEEKLSEQSEALESAQSITNERSTLLNEMVDANKVLENELREARKIVSELQDESEKYLQDCEALKARIGTLKREFDCEREDHYDALQREVAESERIKEQLSVAKKELNLKREEVKETAELRATNFLLTDKIRRQTAFLERKIQKEKTMKERMIPTPNMKSPSRPPVRGRSLTRMAPISSSIPNRRGSSKGRSNSKSSRGPSIERGPSMERAPRNTDELDDILNEI